MPIPVTPFAAAHNFDAGPVVVPAAMTEIARLDVSNKRGVLVVEGLVTVAALTGLRISQSVHGGSDHRAVAENTHIVPGPKILGVYGGATGDGDDVHLTPAGGWFMVEIAVNGAHEITVWAQSGGTAELRLRGRAV